MYAIANTYEEKPKATLKQMLAEGGGGGGELTIRGRTQREAPWQFTEEDLKETEVHSRDWRSALSPRPLRICRSDSPLSASLPSKTVRT